MPYVVVFVQWFEIRNGCLCSWSWWNCWPSYPTRKVSKPQIQISKSLCAYSQKLICTNKNKRNLSEWVEKLQTYVWHGKSWWGPCLGQAQKCGRVKLENPNPPHILSLDSNVNKIVLNMNISFSKYSSWKYLPVNIFMTWCKITYTISQLTLSCRGSLC
jgi:hypothetical protein